VPLGGRVVFRNSDKTLHHVYSFAPIRPFELLLNSATDSEPVQFDRPGIAAIGCNIHDQMIAYVYVADTRWAVLTGANGRAEIANLPEGAYLARVWHPQLRPGAKDASRALSVGGGSDVLSFTVSLLSDGNRRSSHERRY
jgi:hypothetical protein